MERLLQHIAAGGNLLVQQSARERFLEGQLAPRFVFKKKKLLCVPVCVWGGGGGCVYAVVLEGDRACVCACMRTIVHECMCLRVCSTVLLCEMRLPVCEYSLGPAPVHGPVFVSNSQHQVLPCASSLITKLDFNRHNCLSPLGCTCLRCIAVDCSHLHSPDLNSSNLHCFTSWEVAESCGVLCSLRRVLVYLICAACESFSQSSVV